MTAGLCMMTGWCLRRKAYNGIHLAILRFAMFTYTHSYCYLMYYIIWLQHFQIPLEKCIHSVVLQETVKGERNKEMKEIRIICLCWGIGLKGLPSSIEWRCCFSWNIGKISSITLLQCLCAIIVIIIMSLTSQMKKPHFGLSKEQECMVRMCAACMYAMELIKCYRTSSVVVYRCKLIFIGFQEDPHSKKAVGCQQRWKLALAQGNNH